MFGMFSDGKGDAASSPTSEVVEVVAVAATTEPIEHSILKDCAKQRDAARQKVVDSEAEVERLNLVIAESARVAATMQSDIAADGGVGMLALVRGEMPPNMVALVGVELASRAAQARLPVATAELEEARRAAMRSEEECIKAGRNLLMVEASKRAAEYRAAFDTIARLYDEMLGVNYGMPPTETLGQEIANSVVGFEIPSFNMGGEYRATMRHIPDERAVANEARRWTAAREAVIADPDCDYRAIIVDPTIKAPPATHLPAGMTVSTKRTDAHRRWQAYRSVHAAIAEPIAPMPDSAKRGI